MVNTLNKSAWCKEVSNYGTEKVGGNLVDKNDWWKWTCEEVREYFRRFRSSFVIYCSTRPLTIPLATHPYYQLTLTTTRTLTACRGCHLTGGERRQTSIRRQLIMEAHIGVEWGRKFLCFYYELSPNRDIYSVYFIKYLTNKKVFAFLKSQTHQSPYYQPEKSYQPVKMKYKVSPTKILIAGALQIVTTTIGFILYKRP